MEDWKLVDLDDIKLVRVPSLGEASPSLVRRILDDSFSPRGLRLSDDYFDVTRADSVWIAYKNGSPAGVAVVEPVYGGSSADAIMAYLDKLGVVPEWQRNGVAKALWEQVSSENPRLCLRADAKNPFNRFYADRCDTGLPYEGRVIYTKGIAPENLEVAHNYAIDKPATLVN